MLVTDKLILWGSTEATVRKTYRKHVGKLPRRQKIESLPEGVMLFVDQNNVQRVSFAVYEPPKWTWQPKTPVAVCAVPGVTQRLQQAYEWDDVDEAAEELEWSASDLLDLTKTTTCDECGGEVPLMDVIRMQGQASASGQEALALETAE